MANNTSVNSLSIDIVIFDLYNTLLWIETDEDSDEFWATIKCHLAKYKETRTSNELRSEYLKQINEAKSESGTDVFMRATKILLQGLNMPTADIQTFYNLFRRKSRRVLSIRGSMLEVAKTLKKMGTRVAILSNTEAVLTEIDFKDTGFPQDIFEQIMFSSDIGYEKPDPHIFIEAIKRIGCTAKACVYIGDNLDHDVRGPSKVDMFTIWLNNGGLPLPNDLPKSCLGVIDVNRENDIIGLIQNTPPV